MVLTGYMGRTYQKNERKIAMAKLPAPYEILPLTVNDLFEMTPIDKLQKILKDEKRPGENRHDAIADIVLDTGISHLFKIMAAHISIHARNKDETKIRMVLNVGSQLFSEYVLKVNAALGMTLLRAPAFNDVLRHQMPTIADWWEKQNRTGRF